MSVRINERIKTALFNHSEASAHAEGPCRLFIHRQEYKNDKAAFNLICRIFSFVIDEATNETLHVSSFYSGLDLSSSNIKFTDVYTKKVEEGVAPIDTRKWYGAGVINVDAGLCWIGDPCYLLQTDGEGTRPKSMGADWSEFCDKIDFNDQHTQFNHDAGHAGLGVCVSTGYGDGTYPVEVKYNEDGRVKEVRIKFI